MSYFPKHYLAQYREQGYLLAKQFIPIDIINRLKAEVKDIFLRNYDFSSNIIQSTELDDKQFFKMLYNLFKHDLTHYLGAAKLANHTMCLHQLAVSELVVNALQELGLEQPVICARPLMWFHSPKLATTERYHRLPAHQEWSNMQGSLNGIVAWLPLTTIDDTMGHLQIIPGSHMQGLLAFENKSNIDYPYALTEHQFKEDDFIEIQLEPGDCLFFSAFLIHRSGVNKSNRVRWTINFRYNDSADNTFIERHFPDPFIYDVSGKLQDDFHPDSNMLHTIFKK
ncbi:MAG: hypothetical protein Tsb005_16920 [Gammaproteobacteria bacterium]